jgi:hypothetical protein
MVRLPRVNADRKIIDTLRQKPEGLNRGSLIAFTGLHKSTVCIALPRLRKRGTLVFLSKQNIITGKIETIYRLRNTPLQSWFQKNAALDGHEKKMSRELRGLLHALLEDQEYRRITTRHQVYKAVMTGDETLEMFREQVEGAWGNSSSEAIERLVRHIEETARAETSWDKTVRIHQNDLLIPRPLIRQAILEAMKEGKIRIQNLAFIAPSRELDQEIQTLERDLGLRIEDTKRRLDGEQVESPQERVRAGDSRNVTDFRSKVLEMIDDLMTQNINFENHEMHKRFRRVYEEGAVLTSLYGEEMASLYRNKLRDILNTHSLLFSKLYQSRNELLRKIKQVDNLPRDAWLKELETGRGLPISQTGAVALP